MTKHYVSQEWNLGMAGHANFDFVDVNLNDDNLLFIDPCRIEQSDHPITNACMVRMHSFFDAFYSAYRDNNSALKYDLLRHAAEENSTHLGYGHPGKGNTASGLIKTFSALNALIRTIPTIGIAQDLPVLIEGFAEDGMSDLLTNILHATLNQYTLDQMAIFNVPPNGLTRYYAWHPDTRRWEQFLDQPCYLYSGKPIMLVPKQFVRKGYLFTTSQYLERVIVERIRENGGGNDPQGRPIPKRYYLENCIPHNSENWRYEEAIRYSEEHPDALSEYHRRLPEFYFENGQAMDDDEIDRVIYGALRQRR